MTIRKVWIDPGHGGKDPGAVANGLKEKDISLRLALGIKQQLETQYDQVQVDLSRSTDVYLTLKERTNRVNAANADILVSIHCNAGGGAGGFETFRYTKASPAALTLQSIVHAEVMSALKPYSIHDRGCKTGNLHMLRESKMPALLTENLFLDVHDDALKLQQPSVIEAIIRGHVQGIAKYLKLVKKGQVRSAESHDSDQTISAVRVPQWKETGREWLLQKAGISPDWKANDTVDIGTLGTILSRLQK